MNRIEAILAALAACTLACETPGIAPGLDQFACDGGSGAWPGARVASVYRIVCEDPGL